jgi:hypothetical protein
MSATISNRDPYTRVDVRLVPELHRCPVCGATAEMWRHQPQQDGVWTVAVMCSNQDDFEEGIDSGCPLRLVPTSFYAPTLREAARYWNDYAEWITAQREARQ